MKLYPKYRNKNKVELFNLYLVQNMLLILHINQSSKKNKILKNSNSIVLLETFCFFKLLLIN